MNPIRLAIASSVIGAALGGGAVSIATPSKSDLYPALAREHLTRVCVVPRAERDAQGADIVVYETNAQYRVRSVVDGLPDVTVDYWAPTFPEVLPTINAMLDGMVTPLAAEQAGLRSATELAPR